MGLKNAVVSLKDITHGKKKIIPAIHPIMDQQNNIFIPRVLAILTGTTIDILNGDEVMHNIHTRSMKNQHLTLAPLTNKEYQKNLIIPKLLS